MGIHIGIHRYTRYKRVLTGTNTQVFMGMTKYTQAYTSIHRYTQAYMGIHGYTQADRHTQVNTSIHRYTCIPAYPCVGYTLKARWLSDLFNRVPKARGE